ncbi:glycosyltransferase family 2 protein [Pedobacter hartonius]|uniref:Glycosyltransferase involved in cell wall bisynthesis n=1 Tax=Pedobacter hartonius TaxID=425514 RepID=A0A1H4FRK9_9SPHI|nr:glycosyltransferase family 2 protein [Pedobacter hartonius]SEA99697.1 Glycosyltransferase involved in cell wall bisynthesis [Pedobacter hartonius]
MNNPLISIAIPFYNNELTIIDAVKSVFAQTYENWELILLDDGSKDNSLELVRNISDKRVKVISDGTNRGLVYRLNQVPSLVSGDYLARMDADDLMDPTRLQKQIDVLLSDINIDLVDTGTYSISETGDPIGIRGLESIEYDSKYVLSKAMLLHASIIGKKEWFVKNPYDPEYVRAEDRELWVRTHKYSNFKRVKEPLYIVREGKVNIRNYISSLRTIRKILYKYGPDILNEKELRAELRKTYLKVFLYKTFGFFSLQNLLSKRRNGDLTLTEKSKAISILNKIRSVDLPLNLL